MPVDPQTRELLRALGEAALRVADDLPIPKQLLDYPLKPAPATGSDQRLLTVTEACARLRISRWSFYRLMHQRQLNTVSIGRRRFVPHTELSRFVDSLGGGVAS
ncbi:DNA-binding protein, excisionase family [Mycobacteroides abscessus subsp. abscessus]|nr:DNA-binding protein, excisionase family [Mycobacteroides abscessus subsp. abscessus]